MIIRVGVGARGMKMGRGKRSVRPLLIKSIFSHVSSGATSRELGEN